MDWPNSRKLDFYHESRRMIENMIYCIGIPTIGAINGTGSHWQLGTKKAAYYAYTGMNINAQAALDLGLVSEVLPREKLLPRAWELAEMIMQAPPLCKTAYSSDCVALMEKSPCQRSGSPLTHQMYDMAIDEEGIHERLMNIKERFQRND
ncbi:enoyl-CoA hydratase/carnithine racemase [Paenibacillus sp. PvR133]|uniref:enoyl-CoA hydratase/isomerase family protein n=1 Tax=Paenibacillus sp. PvR133 TaxID=2806598 RepID=UPI001AE6BE24|nr:enoyl-CoA hydratase-related protein [Paenibacillus sp. PvR133]MBP1175661.1 enoyl-CoA hydratase/carnithine racemase [Paenibacillus sp. PvR133]